MLIRDWLLAEFDHEIGATRRLLERLPEDRLAWTPHAKSWTTAALATHVANLPTWAAPVLDLDSLDLATLPPRREALPTRAEIVRLLDGAAAQARSRMGKTDAEYAAAWRLERDGHPMFVVPRLMAFRTFVLNHLIHHRGQLTVYLRLLDVPLPPLYGPTADEG
jgi:uncharacterized damage-inducible protein DinB